MYRPSSLLRPFFLAIVLLTATSMLPHPAPISAAAEQTPTGYRIVIATAPLDASINGVKMTSYDMPSPADYTHALTYDMGGLKGGGLGGNFSSGNLIIAGHRTCRSCGLARPVFVDIDKIAPGDTAFVVAPDGSSTSYTAVGSQAMEPHADWNLLLASDAADLSLIGCHALPDGSIEYSLITFRRA